PILLRNPNSPFKDIIERERRLLEVARNPNVTEGWRWVALAKKRADAGDAAAAVAICRNLVAAFEGMDGEKEAVEDARRFVETATSLELQKERVRRVQPLLDRAADLNGKGKRADAERIWVALDALYRDDPAGGLVLVAIAQARK